MRKYLFVAAILLGSCTIKRDAYWVVQKTELPSGDCEYVVETSTAFMWTWNDVTRYKFIDDCKAYGTSEMIWCYQLSERYGISDACPE